MESDSAVKRMTRKRTKKSFHEIRKQLEGIEEELQRRGVKVRYERLEASGLKLRSGLCKVKGQVYLFVDKRKPLSEMKEIMKECLEELPSFGRIPEADPTHRGLIDTRQEPGGPGLETSGHES